MRYTRKEGNVEYIYEVGFPTRTLADLLNEIIRKCSYKVTDKFSFTYGNEGSLKFNNDKTQIIEGASLLNGDPEYVDITDVYNYQYEHPGDSFRINGTKIVSPELASIVYDIINKDNRGLERLLDYQNNDDLIPIDEQIANLRNGVNAMSDFDVDDKIDALTELKGLLQRKANKEFFDAELLKSYYERVLQLITFKLDKTITHHDGPTYSFDQLFDKKEESIGKMNK